ncbi:SEC14 cytosolic factor, partial [Durusdinium trenchii]
APEIHPVETKPEHEEQRGPLAEVVEKDEEGEKAEEAIVERCAPGTSELVQDRLIRLPLRKVEPADAGEYELVFNGDFVDRGEHQPLRRNKLSLAGWEVVEAVTTQSVRATNISCVPHNIDAFYFLDESGIQQNAAALKIWEKRGWKVMSYDMIPGTEGVDSARLTGKELKFAPPKWLA